MRHLALILFFLLASTVAISQGCGQNNPGCIVTEAPPNSNNNQAASTSYVDRAVGVVSGAAVTGLNTDVVATGPGNVTATIQPGVVTNAKLANEPSGSIKCQPGATGPPVDCTPNQVSNLLGYCVVDGQSFAATTAGVQSAINTASCNDLYIPAGTYSGTAQVLVARNNIRIHGASGIGDNSGNSYGTNGSTILNFTSCLNNAFQVGDGSAQHTWNGISVEDIAIIQPSGCTNVSTVNVRQSAAGVSLLFRRVRVGVPSGGLLGGSAAVNLENNVFGVTFEDCTLDHAAVGLQLNGNNHLTKIIGGQINNNVTGVETSTTSSSGILMVGVDIEGNTSYGVDIQSGTNFNIVNSFFDNNDNANARAVRVAASVAGGVGDINISNSYFNGGTANYAIEITSNGFNAVSISNNSFNSYVTANILNSTGANNGIAGIYTQNYTFPANTTIMASTTGFDIINFGGAWTAYTLNPSCGTATFSGVAATFKIYGKTTFVKFTFTISAVGTCAGNLTINLPNAIQSAGALSGFEANNTGVTVSCGNGNGATTMLCVEQAYKGTVSGAVANLTVNAWQANDLVQVSGVYESQ